MGYGAKSIDDWAEEVNRTAHDKGWYKHPETGEETERNFGEVIALMHSELSEALEEWRVSTPPMYWHDDDGNETTEYRQLSKPEGWAVELADCVIRIMDTCAEAGVSLEQAIRVKSEYNRTRPYRHGGKRA